MTNWKVWVAVLGYAVIVGISFTGLLMSNQIIQGGWFYYLVGFTFGILFALASYEMYRGFVQGQPTFVLGDLETSDDE